jgi:hypothetical protein
MGVTLKESDVRERLQAFLKSTVRLAVPATMGIGLALSACGSSSSEENSPDAGADVMPGQGGSGGVGGQVSLYGSSMPSRESGGNGGAGGQAGLYNPPLAPVESGAGSDPSRSSP